VATISAKFVLDTEEMAANIEAVYDASTPAERLEGHNWYPEALELAATIADTFGFTVEQAAKVIAATSAATGWSQNQTQAYRAVSAYVRTGREFPEGIGLRSGRQWKSICEILEGTYKGSSPKWSAFAANILGEKDAVTVDRHAMRIAMADGTKYDSCTIVNYRKIAEAYRMAADSRGIAPRDMQAITWVSYRNSTTNRAGNNLSQIYG
jgi:hypothetical protein